METPKHVLTFCTVEGEFSVLQLGAAAAVPPWALDGPQPQPEKAQTHSSARPFASVTRTAHELSIVCPTAWVPPADPAVLKHEPGWCCLMIDMGVLPFGLTGVLLTALGPLATAGIGIFALSTYNTDFVLVKQQKREQALQALRAAGHMVKSQ
jgi:hypothetical protein